MILSIGVLGGLISSSPTSACIQPYEAMIIGAVGALVACFTNEKLSKQRMKIDDPVGAVGAHAMAASWGILAVGLFANSQFEGIDVRDGLFHGGGLAQLGSQCLEIVAIIAWSTVAVSPFFYLVGIAGSRNLKDARSGLLLEFDDQKEYPHQADPRIHDCREENIDMKEVMDHIKEDKEFQNEMLEEMYKAMLERLLKDARLTEKVDLGLNDMVEGGDTGNTISVVSDESSQPKVLRRRTLSV